MPYREAYNQLDYQLGAIGPTGLKSALCQGAAGGGGKLEANGWIEAAMTPSAPPSSSSTTGSKYDCSVGAGGESRIEIEIITL